MNKKNKYKYELNVVKNGSRKIYTFTDIGRKLSEIKTIDKAIDLGIIPNNDFGDELSVEAKRI